jgi:hypothetical protein
LVVGQGTEIDCLTIAYKVIDGGRVLLPDVLYPHEAEPCCIVDAHDGDEKDAGTGLPRYRDTAVATGSAAALQRLPPHAVVAALLPARAHRDSGTGGERHVLAMQELGRVVRGALSVVRRLVAAASLGNGMELEEWLKRAVEVLRLTVSQRAQLSASALCALARGGSLPNLPTVAVQTKTQGKAALSSLRTELDGQERPAV